MLKYLVTARVRRELFRLLWDKTAIGSVSELSRCARVAFSAAHRELEDMREAGLARAERRGAELVYRAESTHPQAKLLRQLAASPDHSDRLHPATDDDVVRGWLAMAGAPLGAAEPSGHAPPLPQVLAAALRLAHRDATIARVLPLLLWRQRDHLDLEELRRQAHRHDETQALGYFLELAGRLGDDPRLVRASLDLRDKRRSRPRMFFDGPHGPRAAAAARRNSPKEALRWGYLMNMGLDSFRSAFEKFEHAR